MLSVHAECTATMDDFGYILFNTTRTNWTMWLILIVNIIIVVICRILFGNATPLTSDQSQIIRNFCGLKDNGTMELQGQVYVIYI